MLRLARWWNWACGTLSIGGVDTDVLLLAVAGLVVRERFRAS